MAKAIAATPTLTWKDADRFVQNLNKPATPEKRNSWKNPRKYIKILKLTANAK